MPHDAKPCRADSPALIPVIKGIRAQMRVKSLDGLRGIAALIVMFRHMTDTSPAYYMPHASFTSFRFWSSPLSVLKYTPLRILIAGPASVLLFFVLSGFVLCLSERRGLGYSAYLVKRAFRIYPLFLFSILFSAVLYNAVDPHHVASASDWFNQQNWTDKPSPHELASNALMLGIPEWPTLNIPTWSLVHEARISLIFPLIVVLLTRSFWPSVVAGILVSMLALSFPIFDPLAYTVELSVGYVGFFVVGAAIAMRASKIIEIIRSMPNWSLSILWLLAVTLLIAPMEQKVDALAPGSGAVLLILLCLSSSTAQRFLESTIPLWLGRVSYSLYLIHVPILLTVVHLGGNRVPLPALCLAAAGIALVSAEICYRIIEEPMIMLGRRMASALAARHVVEQLGEGVP